MTKILLFTYIPSPYQVELFNCLASISNYNLTVAYIHEKSSHRQWKLLEIKHNHLFLEDKVDHYDRVRTIMERSDLVIFNYYQNLQLLKLINERAASQKPWCFWGERTGYRLPPILGAYYRKWKLAALHLHQVPIWGMGNWAIEQYRREFGESRPYFNMPYISDLTRFSRSKNTKSNPDARHFLYSGSLIYRKGVDLLARAFSKLAAQYPQVSLSFLGNGPLQGRLGKQLAKYGDRVKFLGFQSWENLPQFYHTADILCLPSRHDGWGMVIPEGMAAGLPVIGTDRTGAARELIKTNENGWLIPSGDVTALYHAMKEATLLSNSALHSYGDRARVTASNYSLTNGVVKFNNCVQKTLEYFS